MNAIVEKTTCYITVSFMDKLGAPAIPTAINYRLIDLATGTVIITTTAFPTPAASIELTLGILANTLIKEEKQAETRRLIVEATYGTDDGITSFHDYLVKNSDKV